MFGIHGIYDISMSKTDNYLRYKTGAPSIGISVALCTTCSTTESHNLPSTHCSAGSSTTQPLAVTEYDEA